MDIIEFLKARLDEEEAKARAAHGATWVASQRGGVVDLDDTDGNQIAGGDGGLAWSDADFMAHNHPARVLREIAAKHAILLQYTDAVTDWEEDREAPDGVGALEAVILRMAGVYAAHPDYRQEWAP